MEEQKEKLSAIAQAKPYKIIISKPAGGEIPYRRIVIERKESYYQAAAYTEKQVFHENIPPEKLAEYLGKTAVGQYLQVNAWDDAAEHIYLCSKKGKVTYKTKKNVQTAAKASGSHNRKKQYILEEGTPIEPLVDMGVFTPEPERAQATISGPELRCKYNAAFKNLHIAASGNYNLFTTTNATYDPTLHVEDCTVDAAYNVVYDSHNTQNFKSVYFGNSIVKMTVANKPFYSTKAKDAHTQQLIRLDNNVFYAETPLQNYLINCGDRSQAFQTTRLQVEVTNNTIYNIYQPNIMIRAYVLAGLTVTKNVGYYTGVTAKNYLTGVYDTAGFTADKAEVTYNYLYTAPVSDTNFWSAKHTGSYTPANNQMGDGVEAPFSSMDAAKGYFPVDASVVKTGAGATYDTKAWFKAE